MLCFIFRSRFRSIRISAILLGWVQILVEFAEISSLTLNINVNVRVGVGDGVRVSRVLVKGLAAFQRPEYTSRIFPHIL